MLRRLLGEHIELAVNVAPNSAVVRADPAHIEQVIVNLAVNARDAMPDGGTITLETGNCTVDPEFARSRPPLEPGPHVRLTVRDTGTGIPDAIRARILEPFFTTKEPGRGTGLGLATVYGIVQQCRGHIDFHSRPGRGSEFSVLLPAHAADADQEQAVEPGLPLSRGETLLVAEDEPQVRKLTKKLLSRAGYRVFLAEDGAEALTVAAELERIDLLLTDVRMPRLGGVELARRLRAERPGLRVLFMSGYLDADARADELGSPLMPKPFTMRELLSRVRAALDEAKI
jgi:CheY-like chemotaxis protein